jgi:hypothetical protein
MQMKAKSSMIRMIKKPICLLMIVLQSCGDPRPVKPAPVVLSAFGLAFASQEEFESEFSPAVQQKLRQALMEQNEKGPRRTVLESLLVYSNYGEAYLDCKLESGDVFLDEERTLILEVVNDHGEFRLLVEDDTGQWEGKFYASSPELREALRRDDSLKLVPRKREPSER